ncbi:PaaI family thioesterase [Emcibacter sp. SYSU 3D8]|uniref:PaaI family thioesterase n=1 Tax=Emcibacter sp. SYSU 3D8 TaxID=3133969 RepID=UPI0031FEF66B
MTDDNPTRRRSAAINDTLGATFIDGHAEQGWIRIRYLGTEAFDNSSGLIQGGILAAMLDNAMSRAVLQRLDDGQIIQTLEMKTTFIGPAPIGPVVCEGQVVRQGRSIVFLEGRLFNEAGDLLVTASSTAKLGVRKR